MQLMICANSRGELERRRSLDRPTTGRQGSPVMVMGSKRLLGTSTYTATERHVSVARRWVRDLLSGHIDEETLYDVTLCAAELADNARKHGPKSGAISVAVYRCGDIVRLEVTNDAVSLSRPHVTDACFSTEGHGLQIVSDLAKDWGVYENDDLEQVVWCELHG
jgi:two-component sensor histidine kinase